LHSPSGKLLLLLLLRESPLIEKRLAVLPLLLPLLDGVVGTAAHAAAGAKRTPAAVSVSMIASWPW
jgi:hypothetical protein